MTTHIAAIISDFVYNTRKMTLTQTWGQMEPHTHTREREGEGEGEKERGRERERERVECFT